MLKRQPLPFGDPSPFPDAPAVDRARRRWCVALAAPALGGLASLGGCASVLREPVHVPSGAIVPFSASAGQAGGLPQGWEIHRTRRDLPMTRYEVAERDGRTVAHSIANSSTSGLRCDIDVDPRATPWLEWDWRVDSFPAKATVSDDDVEDSPARVVVGFDGDMSTLPLRELMFRDQVELFTGQVLPFATLAYTWDGRVAVDQVVDYPRSKFIRNLIVESGQSGLGGWHHYRRNVVDDYRRVFGAEPGRIRSVGILTDSDDLKTRIEAWFGDLTFGA
jgi:hypothetical protein